MMVLQREPRGETKVLESVLHVSLVDTLMADRFSWETVSQLGSDHLLLMLVLGEDIKVECDHTSKLLFRKCLDNGIHVVTSVVSLSKRLEAFCNLQKKAEAIPIKAVHKRVIPWMNYYYI